MKARSIREATVTRHVREALAVWILAFHSVGCGPGDPRDVGGAPDSGTDSAQAPHEPGPDAGAALDPEGACDQPTPPECVDEMFLDLSLHDDLVSDGEVTTTRDGNDFVTTVDATAGGFGQADRHPWVYVRFGQDGAERVDIDDETALESMEWDMALRRFIVRLNGGDSGPSCVGAASFLERRYGDLTEVPEGLEWRVDDYYTDDCTMVNDSSGLPGSPQVVLAPWWRYAGCVATTGVPHLVRLASGQVIKLVVERYYDDPGDQAACNDAAAAPPGAVSAVFALRWRFLP